MFLFRRINTSVVLGSSIIIGVATVVSFWFAFGKDEGQLGTGCLGKFIADSFSVFRFPTHVLFWPIFNSSAILFFYWAYLKLPFLWIVN